MTLVVNRIFIFFFSSLLLIAAGCYAYWQEIYFLFVPFVLLMGLALIQHPEYLFYFLMLSIPWSVEYDVTTSLATDLPDEPLMLVGAVAVVFMIVYKSKEFPWRKWHPLGFIVVLQFLWIIVTTLTSTDFTLSLKYLAAKSWYLLAFLVLPLLLFKEERIFKTAMLLLLSSMLAVMFVTLYRHSPYNFSFENVNDAVKPFFRNHVNYSALLVFMVPIEIAMISIAKSKTTKFIISCLLVFTMAALYFSYARGAWLALIAGILAYWLIQKRMVLLTYILLLMATIAAVLWLKSNDRYIQLSNDYKSTIYHTDFREHFVATYKLKDLSNAERLYRWIAGVRMVEDSWRTGFGPSTFYNQYKSYTLPAFKTYVSNNPERSTVHNYFLLLLIEQGIIGFLLFVFLIAMLFWYAEKIYHRTKERFWKALVAAAAAILVMQCVINFLSDMIETDKAGSVFYLCIAALIIADLKTRSKSDLSADIQSIP